MKWTRGRATVDQLLAEGRLEPVTGAAADGAMWLVSAGALLESAKRESERNPEAAYVLAYDAARKASTALVVQQGLRPKSAGHHVTVEHVVRAQFGGPFDGFGALRRRRSEIEYPQRPNDDIEHSEAETAIAAASRIHAAAVQLQPQLELYR
jgi:HEPN domain-containing protein